MSANRAMGLRTTSYVQKKGTTGLRNPLNVYNEEKNEELLEKVAKTMDRKCDQEVDTINYNYATVND